MKDENSIKYRIIVIVIFVALGLGVVRAIYEGNQLSLHHRFAIATTDNKTFGGHIQYHFEVKGIVYRQSTKVLRLQLNGSRYFVKFNSEDPSQSAEMVSAEEVPNCIGDQPADGWEEIPTCK
jgi:hypothetical protein